MALNNIYGNEAENNLSLFNETSVTNYVKKISKIKSLSQEEEQELAIQAKSGSVEAKQKLIEAHLKLVIIIARKVIHSSKLPMIDLIQEGNVGLIAAVDKFNPTFGYRFATYASWWVKQAMFKAISEQSHCIKIPVYIQETLSKYSKVKSEMERECSFEVKSEDVAKRMNIESEKINNYLNAYKKTLSLEADYEIKNGSEVKLLDIIEDEKASAVREAEYDDLKKDIVSLMCNLKDREQKVIILRFGLNGGEKQTLEEIGKLYGVTKECIRQTESRALNKLKNNGLTLSLFQDYAF